MKYMARWDVVVELEEVEGIRGIDCYIAERSRGSFEFVGRMRSFEEIKNVTKAMELLHKGEGTWENLCELVGESVARGLIDQELIKIVL